MRPTPTPPVIAAQSAQPTQLNPTLAAAPLWTYGLTYLQEPTELDDIIVTASFNVAEPVTGTGTGALAQQSYAFSTHLSDRTESDGTIYLETLTLTTAQATPSPSNQWPNAFYGAPDGTAVPLAAGSPAGSTVVYRFPADIAVWARPIITLEWPGLPVTTVQNGIGSVRVRALRPRQASSAVVPLNIWPEPFDITGAGTTPKDALQSAFQTVFGTLDGQLISLRVSFGYGSPMVTVPVALLRTVALEPGTADVVGAAMREWETNYPLPDSGGEWLFSLTFYAGLDGLSERPLLTLERLVYRINGLPSQTQP